MPGTFAGLADDGAALTGATTAGAAFTTSFFAGFWTTTSSSLSESKAAKLFMAFLVYGEISRVRVQNLTSFGETGHLPQNEKFNF